MDVENCGGAAAAAAGEGGGGVGKQSRRRSKQSAEQQQSVECSVNECIWIAMYEISAATEEYGSS